MRLGPKKDAVTPTNFSHEMQWYCGMNLPSAWLNWGIQIIRSSGGVSGLGRTTTLWQHNGTMFCGHAGGPLGVDAARPVASNDGWLQPHAGQASTRLDRPARRKQRMWCMCLQVHGQNDICPASNGRRQCAQRCDMLSRRRAQPLVAASGAVWCTVEEARGPRSHPNPPRATLATTATASPAKYATNADLGLAPLLSGTKGLGQLAVEAEAALC